MDKLSEKYKSYDNLRLLKILEEAEDYQPKAIEAIRTEVATREINEEERILAKEEIAFKKAQIAEKEQKIKAVEDKAKSIWTEFLATINPLQSELPSIERRIRLIVIVFAALSVYQLYMDASFLYNMLFSEFSTWDIQTILYFMPIVLIISATIFFALRKKIGWTLMTFYLIYMLSGTIYMLYTILTWKERTSSSYIEMSELYSKPSPIPYLISILIFGLTLWGINRVEIRDVFDISDNDALLTIGASIFTSSIFIFGVLY